MAVNALMKFTQGPNTAAAGVAVEGTVADGAVTITNGDNTDVASWKIELLYNPPGSALGAVPGTPVVLGDAMTATPSANFTPDVPGCFRCRMTVRDSDGNPNIDIRNFGIPNEYGMIVPPYQKRPDPLPVDPLVVGNKPDELNFGSQAFGWAGDRASKLYETFIKTHKDDSIIDVGATPFTAVAEQATLYRVLTTTIGAAVTFNLPSSARTGQKISVFDGEGGAFTNAVTVNTPGGETFLDGSTSHLLNAPNLKLDFEKVTSTEWALINRSKPAFAAPVFHGVGDADTTSYARLSAFPFDTSDDSDDTVYLVEYVLETTDNVTPIYADVRIFNVTDSVVVPNTELLNTADDLVPTRFTRTPTKANWNAGSGKIYELQLKMSVVGLPADRVTCTYCSITRLGAK